MNRRRYLALASTGITGLLVGCVSGRTQDRPAVIGDLLSTHTFQFVIEEIDREVTCGNTDWNTETQEVNRLKISVKNYTDKYIQPGTQSQLWCRDKKKQVYPVTQGSPSVIRSSENQVSREHLGRDILAPGELSTKNYYVPVTTGQKIVDLVWEYDSENHGVQRYIIDLTEDIEAHQLEQSIRAPVYSLGQKTVQDGWEVTVNEIRIEEAEAVVEMCPEQTYDGLLCVMITGNNIENNNKQQMFPVNYRTNAISGDGWQYPAVGTQAYNKGSSHCNFKTTNRVVNDSEVYSGTYHCNTTDEEVYISLQTPFSGDRSKIFWKNKYDHGSDSN